MGAPRSVATAMNPPSVPGTAEIVRDVLLHGVAAPRAALPSEPLANERWNELLASCAAARALGFLWGSIEAGELPVDDQQRLDAQAALAQVEEQTARIRDVAATVSRALDEHNIDHRFYKGIALDATAYRPGVRHYGDADLVVRRERFADALGVLRDTGANYLDSVQREPLHRTELGINLVVEDVIIDLHHGVARSPFRERIGDAVFDRPAARVGLDSGAVIPTIDPAHGAAIAALEVAMNDRPPKPSALRDCVQLLAATSPDDVRAAAQEWHVYGIVCVGLTVAHHVLGVSDLLPSWVETADVPARDRRLYRHYHGDNRVRFIAGALLDIRGWRARARFLEAALPDRQAIASTGGWRAFFGRHAPNRRRRRTTDH